jgi:hypothetical protein
MTGIVYLVMLLEFLVPILDETGPEVTLLRQHWAPPHFHRKQIGKDRPNISPPHSTDFTLYFSILGVHQRCRLCAAIGYHSVGNFWEDKSCYTHPRLARSVDRKLIQIRYLPGH